MKLLRGAKMVWGKYQTQDLSLHLKSERKRTFPLTPPGMFVCGWIFVSQKKKGQDNVAPSYPVWLGVWQIQSFQLYNLFKLNWPTSELVEGKKNEGFTGAGAGFSPYWLSSCYMSISFPFERNKRKRHKGLVSILMPSMASIECNKNIVTGVFFTQSCPITWCLGGTLNLNVKSIFKGD